MAGVFVLPTGAAGRQGPVAAYVSTAGWAAAGQRVLGEAWIVSPEGVLTPAEARRIGSADHAGPPPSPAAPTTWRATTTSVRVRGAGVSAATVRWRSRVPPEAVTAAKDVRQWRRGRRFQVPAAGPWTEPGTEVDLVWQRHELFQSAGLDLARSLGVPSALFVPATTVWEAARWGTHRPGWGSWLERVGESPALVRADVVAAGAPEVAEVVIRLGVDPDRIVITPTGVDLDLFDGVEAGRDDVRDRLGLTDRFVVGWSGSFRPFHGLDRAVDAVAALDGDRTTLLLVGDGPERARIEALARERGVAVVSTGTVAHAELPALLAAMDVGLVLAPLEGGFHYSPLKLAEYLAAGVAVVAPAFEPLTERLTDDVDAVLVDPDDPAALAAAVEALAADSGRRARIAAAGRAEAHARWSWDEQLRRVVDAADRHR